MKPLAILLAGLTLLASAAVAVPLMGLPEVHGVSVPHGSGTVRWGGYGHQLAARAAVQRMPPEMPAFFRRAEDQLVYLNPEPDRWRDRREATLDAAMGDAFAPDHWLHMDEVPLELLESETNRFEYARALDSIGLDPEDVGTAHHRIIEMTQRLRSGFRRWREESDPEGRGFIELRILNDAGVLGHYVTDVSNPLHASMHFDGWNGDNPEGFTSGPGLHGRFESEFVSARVTLEDVLGEFRGSARIIKSIRAATVEHLQKSYGQLIRLYELDRELPFGRANESAEHKAFAVERLGAGSVMLRDIWWTAWATSAPAEDSQ